MSSLVACQGCWDFNCLDCLRESFKNPFETQPDKYPDRHKIILTAEAEVLKELAANDKLSPEGWPIDEQAWEYYSRELSRRLRG